MLILTNTTDAIEVVLSATVTVNQLPFYATWRDVTTTTYTPGRSAGTTNNTTDVDVVTGPAASTQRVIDFISVYNQDTTNKTVTLKFDDNGTERILLVATLGPAERIEYTDDSGFRVLANNGSVKQTYSSGTNAVTSVQQQTILGADVVNNNAVANTIADVTGLSFPVNAGSTYYFRFVIWYSAAATTTGSRWSISGPGAPTNLVYRSNYSLTATTQTLNADLTAYDLPATSNATSVNTTRNMAIIEGFITPSANGTVIARFASEVASSAITARAGSNVLYQQIL